jgi:hypothetical protein
MDRTKREDDLLKDAGDFSQAALKHIACYKLQRPTARLESHAPFESSSTMAALCPTGELLSSFITCECMFQAGMMTGPTCWSCLMITREGGTQSQNLPYMLIPICPFGQNLVASTLGVTLVMDVKQEVDECVCVVHPTEVENDGGVEAAKPESKRLDHRGDKDGKCCDEDGSRLLLDHLQLVEFDFAIQERKEGWDKAQKVLGVGSGTHAYAGYVRIGRNKAIHGRA